MGSEPKQEIRALLGRINDAWLKGRPEDLPSALDDCFSEDMVFVGPSLEVVARGREACVGGYIDFVRAAKIDRCHLSDPAIEVSGGTAVAFYGWEMAYTLNEQEHRESGHDVFVFTRTDGKWHAVWRALLASP
jgi:hypothetical protein